jgi:hypothetical protein
MMTRLAVLAWLAVALAAPRVSAQETGSAAAQQLFNDGRRLMKQGAFSEACPKLAESQRLDPGIGTLFNLADCHEQLGKTATAWGEFLEVAAQARTRGQNARVDAARARASALEPRLPRMTILVRANDPGLVVTRDGAEIGRAQWNSALPVDPGEHTVAARAPKKESWLRTVTITPGQTLPVEVPALDPIATPTPAAATAPARPPTTTLTSATTTALPPEPPPAPESPRGPNRVPPAIAFGLAAVGAGVGTAFGIMSKTKHDDAAAHCNGNVCDASGVALRDDARRAGNIATVAFVAGGAALVGGVILWFTATPPTSQSNASLGVGGSF